MIAATASPAAGPRCGAEGVRVSRALRVRVAVAKRRSARFRRSLKLRGESI